MATNGTSQPPAILMREQGSAADNRLFSDFDGWLTAQRLLDEPNEEQIDLMLRQDGKARSLEQVLTLPLRWAGWSIEPQDGDRGEAEFCREVLTRPANAGGMVTSMDLVVAQMASARVFRRAFFEKVFGVRDGRIVLKKLAWRPPATCTILRDPRDQGFAGFKQKIRVPNGTPREEVFRPEKAFVHLHAAHRDPLFGASDLDTCWRIFETKQKVRFLWLAFLENQTMPKGVARHDTKDPDEIQAFAQKVATLKGGGVIGIGPGQEVSPFQSDGSGASGFKDALDWLSAEQSGSVLASFTDLAQQGSGRGSYALSADQSDFYLRSCQGALGEMAANLSSYVLPDVCRWAFGPDAAVPLFRFADLAEHNAEAVTDLWKSLATGASLNPAIPREFLDMLTEKVAHHLELDVDKVRQALESRQAETPAGQLATGVDAAVRLVEESGILAQNGGGADTPEEGAA